jgi:hypothetical protein
MGVGGVQQRTWPERSARISTARELPAPRFVVFLAADVFGRREFMFFTPGKKPSLSSSAEKLR